MSVTGASTVLGVAYFVIKASRRFSRAYQYHWPQVAKQRHHLWKVKQRYQINRYCKLLNKQKHIVGCWKCNSDKILLTQCKYKSLIWIYRWTRWATGLQPTQFRWVGSLPWNLARVGSSGLWTTQTTNLAMVRFRHGPGPEVTVRNCC